MNTRWTNAAESVLKRGVKPGLVPRAIIDPDFERELDELRKELAADKGAGATERQALLSGLYLCNGSLDKSHTLAQGVPDATGSYWHGIMHRMEPDYDNSRYWFRRTGRHPVFERLAKRTAEYLAGPGVMPHADTAAGKALARLASRDSWDPFLWIDIVAAQAGGRLGEEGLSAMLHIQWIELTELLDFSFRACFGNSLLDR
mgnify:CR=1 FL=1